MTAPLDETTWAFLHEVRLRGMVTPPDDAPVATLVGLGYLVRKQEHVVLSRAGRDAHARWARLPPGSDALAVAERTYQAFLPLNRDLLQICHDWQVTPGGSPNDHRDRGYDWRVIDRLGQVDERVGPIVRRLAREVERFAGYRPRLRDALTAVEDGRHEWFTSPRCDSYHTVWMQLHEDLLTAIGLAREDERTP